MGRKLPEELAVESGVMPAVRARMQLAKRLDTALRAGKKHNAAATWRAHTARQLDIDLSDDEDSAGGDHGQGRKLLAQAAQLAAEKQVYIAYAYCVCHETD